VVALVLVIVVDGQIVWVRYILSVFSMYGTFTLCRWVRRLTITVSR
jgi:hypothetical protein